MVQVVRAVRRDRDWRAVRRDDGWGGLCGGTTAGRVVRRAGAGEKPVRF